MVVVTLGQQDHVGENVLVGALLMCFIDRMSAPTKERSINRNWMERTFPEHVDSRGPVMQHRES